MNNINYFIGSNSSKGYISFYYSNFSRLERNISLYGFPSETVLNIASAVRKNCEKNRLRYETVRNCVDNSIDGIIIPEKKSGFFNFSLFTPGAHHIPSMMNEKYGRIKELMNHSFLNYSEALEIHDAWEKIYISNMDVLKLNRLTESIIGKISAMPELKKPGSRVDRYFGAAAYTGSIDYIPDITENISKRYFIKGRPGTGKSTILKKLARKAADMGYDTEIYHCAFDPDSLDLVVIREMDVCFFDSTAPHEYYPTKEGDEIIDVYNEAIKPGTDERYANSIKKISSRYKEKIGSARLILKDIKNLKDEIDAEIIKNAGSKLKEEEERIIGELGI